MQQCSKLHNSHIYNVRNLVFRVMPRLSYEAIRSYRRELKRQFQQAENPDRYKRVPPEEYAQQQEKEQQLVTRKKKNIRLNERHYHGMKGQKVTYGQTIQLMHVDSGFYLQNSKRSSQLNKSTSTLELVEEPAPMRAQFIIQSRYRYRQPGEHVVYNDHILLYSAKYNSYVHASEEHTLGQTEVLQVKPEFRPPSPKRRPDPEAIYRRYEANISSNFYKWQVLNHRQVVHDEAEAAKIVRSGDVIHLRHAESAGYVCYDDVSLKRDDQVYVRMYKGVDASEGITTNCLFEVC